MVPLCSLPLELPARRQKPRPRNRLLMREDIGMNCRICSQTPTTEAPRRRRSSNPHCQIAIRVHSSPGLARSRLDSGGHQRGLENICFLRKSICMIFDRAALGISSTGKDGICPFCGSRRHIVEDSPESAMDYLRFRTNWHSCRTSVTSCAGCAGSVRPSAPMRAPYRRPTGALRDRRRQTARPSSTGSAVELERRWRRRPGRLHRGVRRGTGPARTDSAGQRRPPAMCSLQTDQLTGCGVCALRPGGLSLHELFACRRSPPFTNRDSARRRPSTPAPTICAHGGHYREDATGCRPTPSPFSTASSAASRTGSCRQRARGARRYRDALAAGPRAITRP